MALITAPEVIAKAPTDHSYDPKQINTHIEFAEDKWVRPFLGNTYFDELVTAAGGAGGDTLADEDETFWDEHLHAICAYAVIIESIPYVATRVTNQGIMKNFTDNSASASNGEVDGLIRSMTTRLKEMKKVAADWLTHSDRSADYPDFTGNTSTVTNYRHNAGVLGL